MAGIISSVLITLIALAALTEGALIAANWLFAINPTATAIHEFFRLGLGVAIVHMAAAVLLFGAYRRRRGGSAIFAITTAAMAAVLAALGVLWLASFDFAAQPLRIMPIQPAPDGSTFRFAGAAAAIAIGLAGFSSLIRPHSRWPLLTGGAMLAAEALFFMFAAIRPSNILLLLLGIGYLLAGAEEYQEIPEY